MRHSRRGLGCLLGLLALLDLHALPIPEGGNNDDSLARFKDLLHEYEVISAPRRGSHTFHTLSNEHPKYLNYTLTTQSQELQLQV